jgi:phage gp36-like protein
MSTIIDSDYLISMFDKRRILLLVDDGDGPKAVRIDDAINAAEAEVHGILSRQYTLSDLQSDASIKRVVATTAMHILELRRGDVSAGVIAAYNQALSYLQRLVEGSAKLGSVPEVLPRITQTNSEEVFEHTGYFIGLPDVRDEMKG